MRILLPGLLALAFLHGCTAGNSSVKGGENGHAGFPGALNGGAAAMSADDNTGEHGRFCNENDEEMVEGLLEGARSRRSIAHGGKLLNDTPAEAILKKLIDEIAEKCAPSINILYLNRPLDSGAPHRPAHSEVIELETVAEELVGLSKLWSETNKICKGTFERIYGSVADIIGRFEGDVGLSSDIVHRELLKALAPGMEEIMDIMDRMDESGESSTRGFVRMLFNSIMWGKRRRREQASGRRSE